MDEKQSRIPEYTEALDKMREIHIRKNADYSIIDNPLSNFQWVEIIISWFRNNIDKVYAAMLGVKIARLAVLLSSDKPPKNESVEDSFLDAANYLLLWRADYMRRNPVVKLASIPEEERTKLRESNWQDLCAKCANPIQRDGYKGQKGVYCSIGCMATANDKSTIGSKEKAV